MHYSKCAAFRPGETFKEHIRRCHWETLPDWQKKLWDAKKSEEKTDDHA